MELTYKWHYCRNTLHCRCTGVHKCAHFHPKLCNLHYHDTLADEGLVVSNSTLVFGGRYREVGVIEFNI